MKINLDALRAALKAADDNTSGSLMERRAALLAEGKAVLDQIKALDNPDHDDPEALDAAKAAHAAAVKMDAQIDAAAKSSTVLRRLGAIDRGAKGAADPGAARYLGLGNPARAKSAATALATKMAGPNPSEKALGQTGTAMGDIPMVDIYERPDLPTTILDLLPMAVRPVNWSFLREIGREDNAAVVPAGEVKPESDYDIERVDEILRVVAHLSNPFDKYIIEDFRLVAQYLERRMYAGLRLAIESAILVGDGLKAAGPPRVDNVRGILNTSGIQTRAFATDLLTTIRKAITGLESVGHQATALVLSPSDWEALELSRAPGGGHFDLGPANLPVDRAARRVWGVPTVTSNILPAKTGVLLDLDAVEFVGDGRVDVEWNPYTGFARNEVQMRVESRIGVGVKSGLGVVKVATQA
ncbi:phage major capsid protein [Rhodococcus sp. BP-316]|uniref:phage major capsid family protein n=1 Tax=Rhodococcus sp. BP-316 TaxID=2739445 RepID=UPI001C9A9DD1|nr:phage major capsid protein [Rhodococcus sp. BP-316]MBY6679926.1 phage major capsid protein [Rhodococcus sp. BP-316]